MDGTYGSDILPSGVLNLFILAIFIGVIQILLKNPMFGFVIRAAGNLLRSINRSFRFVISNSESFEGTENNKPDCREAGLILGLKITLTFTNHQEHNKHWRVCLRGSRGYPK